MNTICLHSDGRHATGRPEGIGGSAYQMESSASYGINLGEVKTLRLVSRCPNEEPSPLGGATAFQRSALLPAKGSMRITIDATDHDQ